MSNCHMCIMMTTIDLGGFWDMQFWHLWLSGLLHVPLTLLVMLLPLPEKHHDMVESLPRPIFASRRLVEHWLHMETVVWLAVNWSRACMDLLRKCGIQDNQFPIRLICRKCEHTRVSFTNDMGQIVPSRSLLQHGDMHLRCEILQLDTYRCRAVLCLLRQLRLTYPTMHFLDRVLTTFFESGYFSLSFTVA